MVANKYQLRKQWSGEETCRSRGLNKTHFSGVWSCREGRVGGGEPTYGQGDAKGQQVE